MVGRNTQGVRLINLNQGEQLVEIQRVNEPEGGNSDVVLEDANNIGFSEALETVNLTENSETNPTADSDDLNRTDEKNTPEE